MREVMDEVREWTAAGDRVAVATVVETWGSSPRPLGSKMVVSASGRMAGSVSNGCIEGAVFEEAQKVLQAGRGRLVPYGVADDVAFEVGLACGGHVEVMIQPLAPAHLKLIELLEKERPAILRTNLETGETVLGEAAPRADLPYREGAWFVEPQGRPPHLVIVGGIHIAIPLHRLAKIPLDRSTYIVILTHDPKFDLPALRAVLGKDVRYIGAIGSRKTNQNRFDQLREEGFTDEQIAQVHGPIGLDLGGRSAEETALAIMAEVTAVRYDASAQGLKEVKAARA